MRTIRIERQYWTGGPTPADCTLIKETERREVSDRLPLVDGLGRTHQLRILGAAGRGLRIAVEDLSVKRGAQLQSSGIDLTGCHPQELVVDFGEIIELNTCTLDAGTTYRIMIEVGKHASSDTPSLRVIAAGRPRSETMSRHNEKQRLGTTDE